VRECAGGGGGEVRAAVSGMGLPSEKRPERGHVTGRNKGEKDLEEAEATTFPFNVHFRFRIGRLPQTSNPSTIREDNGQRQALSVLHLAPRLRAQYDLACWISPALPHPKPLRVEA
jgi:hypothetical protein